MKHARPTTIPSYCPVIAAFGVCAVLFGAIFFFPLHRTAHESAATPPNAAAGTRYTAVLLFHDVDTLAAAVALHVDTAACTVQAVGYPAQTETAYGTHLGTLAACFADSGEDAAAYVAECDVTLTLSVNAVTGLVSRLGGVPYTVRQAVGTLSAGYQTLGAMQVNDILRFTAWDDTVRDRARVYAEITAALLNRYLKDERRLPDLFRLLTEYSDTHLTVAAYTAAEPALRRLAAGNHGALCTATVAAGYTVGVGESKRYVTE